MFNRLPVGLIAICFSLIWGCPFDVAGLVAANATSRMWEFDDDEQDRLPPDFVVGTFFDGRPAGDWKVISSAKAVTPPRVLAQLRDKGAEHNYNMVLVADTDAADLDLSVSLLPISGKADMGGGAHLAGKG